MILHLQNQLTICQLVSDASFFMCMCVYMSVVCIHVCSVHTVVYVYLCMGLETKDSVRGLPLFLCTFVSLRRGLPINLELMGFG